MTFLGFAALILALSAAYGADIKSSRQRLVVFVLLFVMHLLGTVAYYFFAEASGSDAHFYFYDSYRLYGYAQGLGTPFILNFVQILKERLGGTFFDYFLLFQAMGFWGLVILTKVFNDIFEELEVEHSAVTYLPLYLPGLHFWTGAIGKDAPLFLGVCLTIWASMNLSKRLTAMAAGVAIMLAVRPHVAIIALVSLGIAAMVDPRVKLWVKGLLVAGIIGAGGVVATSLETTFRVDVRSAESVGEFMAARGSISEESGVDLSIVQGNFAMKVFSLWLRPFYIDAENSMGYIASLENTALMIIFGFIIANFGLLRRLSARVLYVRYSIIFFVLLTLLLAAVNFNLGLGLRQKMMAMPTLLTVLATLMAARMLQRSTLPGVEMVQYRTGGAAGPSASTRAH